MAIVIIDKDHQARVCDSCGDKKILKNYEARSYIKRGVKWCRKCSSALSKHPKGYLHKFSFGTNIKKVLTDYKELPYFELP